MTADTTIALGSIVEGTVTRLANFGAFVLLPNGKTGLVHISEVADVFVRDIGEHLQLQQVVQVKVMSCDETGKIALSIKQALPGYQPAARPRERRGNQSLEDKIAKFLKDSEDKQTDLKRLDSKRGGRGSRTSFGD